MLEAERALVAASLGETTPREATDRICAALARVPGVTCTLLEGHEPRPPDAPSDGTAHLLLGHATDETARTLVITHADAFEPAILERTKRIFERLLDMADPIRQRERAVHEMNNRLAGLASNLELMELLIEEAATRPLDEPRRQDLSTAAAYALASCRALCTAVGALSGALTSRASDREAKTAAREPNESGRGPDTPSGRP